MEEWIPKTALGKKVLAKQIVDVNVLLDNGLRILEPQITDTLIPDLESDLLLIGQSKGKFGGGRRRVFRQTQKKTREGNKPRFAAYSVVGNKDGIIGLGYGKARETVPARDKANRQAKLNIFKIARGSGSWESQVDEPHTVPFRVEGRCGSVRVILMPAPKGKGLIAEKEIQKILALAGIQDVWSRTFGQTKNKINLIKATEAALKQLVTTKLQQHDIENLSVVYGSTKAPAVVIEKPSADQLAGVKKKKAEPEKKPSKPAPKKSEPVPEKPEVTPLQELKGVGPATASKLKDADIYTVEDLAELAADDLAERMDSTESAAKKLVKKARNAMEDGS